MGNLSATDWLAVASIALPLIAKALSDWQANLVASHNLRLQRIVGMAGREAAVIANTLGNIPPSADTGDTGRKLIAASVNDILTEMGTSTKAIGANAEQVTKILTGELAKLSAPLPAVSPTTPNTVSAINAG